MPQVIEEVEDQSWLEGIGVDTNNSSTEWGWVDIDPRCIGRPSQYRPRL